MKVQIFILEIMFQSQQSHDSINPQGFQNSPNLKPGVCFLCVDLAKSCEFQAEQLWDRNGDKKIKLWRGIYHCTAADNNARTLLFRPLSMRNGAKQTPPLTEREKRSNASQPFTHNGLAKRHVKCQKTPLWLRKKLYLL